MNQFNMVGADKPSLLLHKGQKRLSRDNRTYLFNTDICDMKAFKNSLGNEFLLMPLSSVKYRQAQRNVKWCDLTL